ncbi:FAD/NAD(P)-binding domain-containing protein [Gyrodon lividus]|nr:FAD/NAD(P)-binding domain-containing protein [Gyrodon lividus]
MKIAVIGSGVSGLAATWLLNEHSDHEVHLFEADNRAGGHANTVRYHLGGEDVDVDTYAPASLSSYPLKYCLFFRGFIVFNPATYPNFLRFLKRYPDITILPTEMTFSVSRDYGLFEWAGNNPASVFCQPSRLLDPSMWRLLYDVLRFNACARRLVIDDNSTENCSIGDYLVREGYSGAFCDDYIIPMTAAIWSTPPDKCALEFPARTLVQFMSNHHLLQITGKPSWLTIKGGSRNYVKAILSKLPESQLHLSTPIASVGSVSDGAVRVKTAAGQLLEFDFVIMACHSDTTLSLLKEGSGITEEEEEILARFTWNRNEAVLHNDISLMPKSRRAWSCWNYLTFSSVDAKGVRTANVDKVAFCLLTPPIADNMNDLQHLPADKCGPVLVTLNPPVELARGAVAARFRYDHPVLNTEALLSHKQMNRIQGRRRILYAGAWLGYGFHEDGFTSGLRAVAEHIDGVRLPFEITSADWVPRTVFVAHIFDTLERSGIRSVFGKVLSFMLFLLGRLILAGEANHQGGVM